VGRSQHTPQDDHSFIAEECATISDVLFMVNHRLEFFLWWGFVMVTHLMFDPMMQLSLHDFLFSLVRPLIASIT
jgi:hypothetical protein